MKQYDAYLFDWDGTLACTLEVWIGAVREQLQQRGLTVSDKDIVLKIIGRFKPGLHEFGVPQAQVDRVLDAIVRQVTQQVVTAPLFDNARELLETLKARLLVYIGAITTFHQSCQLEKFPELPLAIHYQTSCATASALHIMRRIL